MDREHVRIRGSRAERCAYHAAAAEIKHASLSARKQMGSDYLGNNAPGVIIPERAGFATLDISEEPVFRAALTECRALLDAAEGKPLPSKGSLEFVAGGGDFSEDSACVALALSPLILAPVTRYLGMLPVLFNIGINTARATDFLPSTSHAYHIDPEDVTQMKVFIHLTDVEADRAFHALPAYQSSLVMDVLGYGIGRLDDATVSGILNESAQPFCAAGPVGSVAFCDTARCLHFGGRPGRLTRHMLAFLYCLPTSTWFPRFDGDGERRNLLPRLRTREGDDMWNALIGNTLT